MCGRVDAGYGGRGRGSQDAECSGSTITVTNIHVAWTGRFSFRQSLPGQSYLVRPCAQTLWRAWPSLMRSLAGRPIASGQRFPLQGVVLREFPWWYAAAAAAAAAASDAAASLSSSLSLPFLAGSWLQKWLEVDVGWRVFAYFTPFPWLNWLQAIE